MTVHYVLGSMKYLELQSAFLPFLAWALLNEPAGWGGLCNQDTAFADGCELVNVLCPPNQAKP